MPYLNLKSFGVQVAQETQPPRLRAELPREACSQLVRSLHELLESPATELRVDLTEQWTLFWKIRQSESRVLLAHPEKDAWVATVALESGHLSRWLSQVEHQGAGISETGTLGRVSNLDIWMGQLGR